MTVSATANDKSGVAGVQFMLDGVRSARRTRRRRIRSAGTRAASNGAAHADRGRTGRRREHEDVRTGRGDDRNAACRTAGLRAAYGFDDGSGTIARRLVGQQPHRHAVGGTSWTSGGRYGERVSLQRRQQRVDLPPLGTFYKTGFTLEAWIVEHSAKTTSASSAPGTAAAAVRCSGSTTQPATTCSRSAVLLADYLDSGTTPRVGHWQHVAATYDGATARIYVDGVEVAVEGVHRQRRRLQHLADRRLPRSGRRVLPGPDRRRADLRPASDARRDPDGHGPAGPARQDSAAGDRVHSDRPGQPGSASERRSRRPSTSRWIRQRAANGSSSGTLPAASCPRPSRMTPNSQVATLTPQAALQFGATVQRERFRRQSRARPRRKRVSRPRVTWTFTTEPSPPPILVVNAAANPFGSYLTRDPGQRGPGRVHDDRRLAALDVAAQPLRRRPARRHAADSGAGRRRSTTWVNGGGNLVAMRPDKQLAGCSGWRRRPARSPTPT